MSSSAQSLTAQCEEILAAIKEFEQSPETDRALRLALVQSLEKLTLCLKDPKEAIFDNLTNFVSTCNLRGLLELCVPETIPVKAASRRKSWLLVSEPTKL
ncbi:hypothetical protein VTN77DRAFT_9749 [Rasamsonia byssochlamydoides]|uniref:uncharacterized protein n=1 Tax=Rasamsonia byssochlamydoides TaxID=89139 RepID=UPI0037436EF2